MTIKTAFAAALTATGLLFGAGTGTLAHADALAPHEKTVTAPNGMTVTVGHLDNAVRPVSSMNFMPTTRQAYLDNTSYGRVVGGNGKLHSGFFVACAVDLDVKFTITATAGIDVDLSAGVSAGMTGVTPSASASISPEIGGHIGVNLSLAPGKIVDVKLPTELSDKELPAGNTGYLIDRDYHLYVENCAGPLTVQAYTVIEASSPEANVAEYVMGDPYTL
ncbi:MspA family porin [Nocardia sp. NPDC051030]|uniref:MspA family porin n=1 Tax=Nocardia sp. NPDC051030 TaxID=3155162 RepID=UPI00341A41A6